MGHAYQAVGWNRQKRIYDLVLAGGIVVALAVHAIATLALSPDVTAETLLIRGFGTVAFLLLHVVLSIGPLCRLDQRFLPLLYNRRHMGVAMFFLAAGHGTLSFVLYHALGVISPLASLFAGDTGATGFAGLPFQPLGAVALGILYLMAATSHDFWLRNLGPSTWKALHMLVYVAWGLVVMHVALGYLQAETSPWLAGLVACGMVWILGLHLFAARRERRRDAAPPPDAQGWVDAGPVAAIPQGRASVVTAGGERVAVFRYGDKLSAVASACRHQGGPLGEGRVVDGCIVCPWHGYQYRPEDGRSPAPFTERVPTYHVRVLAGRAQVLARPLPSGTPVEPASCAGSAAAEDCQEQYIGYLPRSPRSQARFTALAAVAVLATCLAAVAIVATSQRELRDSRFEFGVVREFAGVVENSPYPMLRVPRPGGGSSSYLLVAPGKHGADELVAAFAGRGARLEGSLVHQDGRTMIELVPGSVRAEEVHLDGIAEREPLGRFTLRGEIVDSKCHLGVMNPGERRTHRACAKLCIRGGIPPLFMVEDGRGALRRFLLVGERGEAVNARVLDMVGDPLQIEGEVERDGDMLVLRADPASYLRLAE